MSFVDLPQVRAQNTGESPEEYMRHLANLLSMYRDTLDFVINGHINFKNIQALGITTNNLKAGSVVADKISVTELSAITANLGTITAGLLQAVTIISSTITGSLIQTAASGTYPRVELNSTSTYIRAQASANDELRVDTTLLGSPAVVFDNGAIVAAMYLFSLFSNIFMIQSEGEIRIYPGTGFDVVFRDWDEIYSTGDSQNLQTALNAKANSFTGLTSAVGVMGSDGVTPKTLNFTNGVLTSVT